MGEWKDALNDYGAAVRLAPNFSFASANYALVSDPLLVRHPAIGVWGPRALSLVLIV